MEYDNGIATALGDIWSDVGNEMTDATAALGLGGSNWTDFASSTSGAALSDVSNFLGDTGLYLNAMNTDVQAMLMPISLPGVMLPTTIEWTDVGGMWNFAGTDETISPFVGPPGAPVGSNLSYKHVNGTARINENGNLVIQGTFENRNRTTDGYGVVIQETYALVEAGTIQVPGMPGSIQGLQIDYLKTDHPTTTSGVIQRFSYQGSPSDPAGAAHIIASIARREDNKAVGFTFDKPAFQQPSVAGYIQFTGADHTIQLSAGRNAIDPSQNFLQGLLSMNKTVGTGEGSVSLEFSDQNNQKSLTTQLMMKQSDTLMKLQANTTSAFGGMYNDWDVAGSAIYKFNTLGVPSFAQVGYQKSRSGFGNFFATDTSFGAPNYDLSWRNQGFVILPDPSISGGYARVYAAIPLPNWMQPSQIPDAYGFGRRRLSLVVGGTAPFDQPLQGTTYFFGVSTGP